MKNYYLNSTCLKVLGYDENCNELKLLIKFRDDYVMKHKKDNFDAYKEMASVIIEFTNQCEPLILKLLFYDAFKEKVLDKTILLINEGKYEEAFKFYKENVQDLYERITSQ